MDEKRVLIYCRESRDEGGLHRERIETQKAMLVQYAAEKKLGRVVRMIVDDDMTGTDFRRLDVVRLLAERREIDILLLKDSSRLGRNLSESLLFTELLARNGVELVFASEAYNEDIFPLEAWFHEMRAKEDSRKIRAVLYHKMEAGELLIAPPYGYRREGTRLAVDDGPAAVVKGIFAAFLAGQTPGEIARGLDAVGVPPPSLYKGRQNAAGRWSSATVRRILGSACYRGTREMKKTVGRSFKDKTRLLTPNEARIVREHDHEAIISDETFCAAAARLAASRRGSGSATAYGGLLCCGGCGGRLVHSVRKERQPAYVCAAYHRGGRAACAAHRVTEAELAAVTRGAAYGAWLCCEAAEKRKPPGFSVEELYEDLAAGRISRAFFERCRASLYEAAAPEADFCPAGHEAALAPLVIRRITVFEKGEAGYQTATLLVETNY